MLAIPVLIPLMIWGISKPEVFFLFSIAIMNSKLILPGFPGELQLFHITFLFVGVVMFIRMIITKERFVMDGSLRFATLLYGFIAFYTMLARGIGFQVLGTGQAGGMRYVVIYLGVIILWFVSNVRVSQRQIRNALIFSALFSFLPVLAEAVLLLSGGKIYQHYYFLQAGFGLGDALMDYETGQGVRFMSAAILGRGLVYLPFFFLIFSRKNAVGYILLIGMGLFIGAFSGFRSVFIATNLFLLLIGFLMFRNHWKAFVISTAGVGIAGYCFVFLIFDFLPYGIQRTVSFLPFIAHGSEALRDGLSTMDFRYGVWTLAVKEIPQYLWLGRGLAFDQNEYIALQTIYGLSDMIFLRGLIANLHNGALEVLIGFGCPGAVAFVLFLFRASRVSLVSVKKQTGKPEIYRLCCIFTSLILTTVFLFMFSFGTPYDTFLSLCINLTIIHILITSGEKMTQKNLSEVK
ncbi:MAG: hypothetical protein ACO3N7_10735 [Kiritimatiellia bacterium]